MRKIKIINIKKLLTDILLHHVVKQDRKFHPKKSHYATKIVAVLLIAKIIIPVFGSELASAGEHVLDGKVLGAHTTQMVTSISRPIDGVFDMNSKDNLMNSFETADVLTNKYLEQIDESIMNMKNNISLLDDELKNTENEMESIKANLILLILDLYKDTDVSLLEMLLDENKFSDIESKLAQNEVLFSSLKEVFKSLEIKKLAIEKLQASISANKFVLDERGNEKAGQKIQKDSLMDGKNFFEDMTDEEFLSFVKVEQQKKEEFMQDVLEDESDNLLIYNNVMQAEKNKFENLYNEQLNSIDQIDSEINELNNLGDNIDTNIDYLSYEGKIGAFVLENEYDILLELIPRAHALSDKALELIKKKLDKSSKLNTREKRMIKNARNKDDLKKVVIIIIQRIKKDKDKKKSTSKDNADYLKKISKDKETKKTKTTKSSSSVFSKHPIKNKEIYITADYADPEYQRIVGMFHNGIDFGISQKTPVYAIGDGVVKSAVWDKSPSLAYLIVIHGGESKMSAYLHLNKIKVKPGDVIREGQLLGYSGGTPGTTGAGLSSGPHLHFEIREMSNTRTNPYPKYIPKNMPMLKYM